MSRYCLDTSAYSHFKRGHVPVVERIDQAVWIGVPSIVVGELWVGFLLGGRQERNQRDLAEFLSHPVVQELAAVRMGATSGACQDPGRLNVTTSR